MLERKIPRIRVDAAERRRADPVFRRGRHSGPVDSQCETDDGQENNIAEMKKPARSCHTNSLRVHQWLGDGMHRISLFDRKRGRGRAACGQAYSHQLAAGTDLKPVARSLRIDLLCSRKSVGLHPDVH